MKRLSIPLFELLSLSAFVNGAGINAVGTFNNIGLEVQSTRTDTIKIEYKESSESIYKPGHFLSRINETNHAGSIFSLKAGTTYNIKLKLAEGDTIITGATRQDVFPEATGTAYHVSPNGSDANNGTSPASAFKTIGKAVSMAQAGTTVLIHNGCYHEEIEMPRSGTASAPIVIRNAPGEHPIMDGRDTSFFQPSVKWELYDSGKKIYRTATSLSDCRTAFYRGNHVYGFYSAWFNDEQGAFDEMISNPYKVSYYAAVLNGYFYIHCPNSAAPEAADSICLPKLSNAIICNRNYIQFIGLEICYYAYGQYSCALLMNPGSYNLVDSCYFHHNISGILMKGACLYNTIQRLKNRENNIDEFPWSSIKEDNHDYEAGAVVVMQSNSGTEPNVGTVIRYCDFEHQFDCSHLFSSPATDATRDMDFHDNLCWYSGDDGIETDGYCVNVRIYNNHFNRGLTGISLAPTGYGPLYIFRNTITGWNTHDQYAGYPLKMNYDGDCIYNVFFYHNTCFTNYSGQPALWYKIESQVFNKFTCRNNIFAGTDIGIRNDVMPDTCVTMDYDDIYTSGSSFIEWRGKKYSTLSAFSAATGLEQHGLNNVKPEFIDTAGNDFRLIPTSPLIDKGVYIPGVNDDYSGAAPDIGCYEQKGRASVDKSKEKPALQTGYRFYSNSNSAARFTTFYFENNALPAILEIYDLQGKLIYKNTVRAGVQDIIWRVEKKQQPTVYIAALRVGEKKVCTSKVILVK